MKHKSNKLMQLINALTPTEKQYFKKNYGGNYDFIRLFDFLNKHRTLNAKSLLASIQQYVFEAKKITPGYLSVIKTYLKEKILEGLRGQKISKKPNLSALTRIINIDMLIDKGLLDIAKDELELAKNSVATGLFDLERVYLYRQEVLIHFYKSYDEIDFKQLTDACDTRIHNAYQTYLVAQLSKIFNTLNYLRINGLDTSKFLAECKQNKLLQDEQQFKNIRAKHALYWIKGTMAENENNGLRAINYYKKAIAVWLENPENITLHLKVYINLCYNFLRTGLKFNYFKNTAPHKAYFEKILGIVSRNKLTKDEKKFYEQFQLLFQLSCLNLKKEYQNIIQLVPKIKVLFKPDRPLITFIKIPLHFHAAHAFFQTAQYKKALDWLHPMVVKDTPPLRHNPDYAADVIMLYLLTHYDLGNFQFLKYEIKKKEKYLAQYNLLDPLCSHFLELFRKLVNQQVSPKRNFDMTASMKQLLNTKRNTKKHLTCVQNIDFCTWLQTKLKEYQNVQKLQFKPI